MEQITARENLSVCFTERWNDGNPSALAGAMRFSSAEQGLLCCQMWGAARSAERG